MKKIIALLLVTLITVLIVSCAAPMRENAGIFDRVCSAREALEAAKKEDVVVFENNRVSSGLDLWNTFYEKVCDGKAASVICARVYDLDDATVSSGYYEEEGGAVPQVFFYKIDFDGTKFDAKVRLSTEKKLDRDETFKYLLRYEGEMLKTSRYSSYNMYVLADDPDVTREDIWKGLASSQLGDQIRHLTVYEEYYE